jgi:hypothetical protein
MVTYGKTLGGGLPVRVVASSHNLMKRYKSERPATYPFHDIKIYHKSPYYIIKGEMYDEMTDWYEDVPKDKETPKTA